jgi:hypothetical protein
MRTIIRGDTVVAAIDTVAADLRIDGVTVLEAVRPDSDLD